MKKNLKRISDDKRCYTNMRMNTLYKFLIIAFLSVFIFVPGFGGDFVGAQNTAGKKKLVVELSDEEKAWLAAHPKIVLGGGIFPPHDFVNSKGDPVGIGRIMPE